MFVDVKLICDILFLILDNADKILEFAEVKNYLNFPFQSLSTGMRFRLISSICFILKRDIYFIDEFLTTSDEKFQEKSFQKINQFSLLIFELLFFK